MTVPTMHDVVKEMARYVTDSGFSVQVADDESWVAIHDDEEGDDSFFLTIDEARDYLDEVHHKMQAAETSLNTALLAQAKPYIDCL